MSMAFGIYLFKKKIFSLSQVIKSLFFYLLFKKNIITLQHLHRLLFHRLFKDMKNDLILSCAQDFLSKNLFNSLHPLAHSFLRSAQKRGDLTALFSSSPDFLVRLISEKLNFNLYFSTQYKIDKKKTMTEISIIVDAEAKAIQLNNLCTQLGYTKEQVIAYSDGENDLPLLNSAGTSIVFSPTQRMLETCLINRWITIHNA